MVKVKYPVVNGYKKCTKCLIDKPVTSFSKTKKTKEGLFSDCKECNNLTYRLRYNNDESFREKEREKSRLKQNKKRENIEVRLKDISRLRERYNDLKDKPEYIEYRKKRTKEYYNRIKNTEEFKKKNKDRGRDPRQIIKTRIRLCFRRMGFSSRGKTVDILGSDWETVKKHIQSQFQEGMTWDNKGIWHIDHILPMSTAETVEDAIRLNHYTNLQPLWGKDNLSKGSKITVHGILKKYFPYDSVFHVKNKDHII